MHLVEDKLQEINQLKETQVELQRKVIEEITDLKKVQDRLIVE